VRVGAAVRKRPLVPILLAVVAVGVAAGIWSRDTATPHRLCLTALDVGQGDSFLLSLPGDRYWLVDGGGLPGGGYDIGAARVLPALRRRGVDHLDRVLVSHADGDHFEGLFSVIEQISVGSLWIPSRRRLPRRMARLLESAESRGVPIRVVDAGDSFGPGRAPLQVRLVHPWPGWDEGLGREQRSENNRSLVLRLQLGAVSFLLTGDIERQTEMRLLAMGAVERSTVLKAPHHASRTSSTPRFVAVVDPLVAVAGIGRNNRFGFPHASVVARYLGRGTPLYWTGRHGAVRTCTDGYSLWVEQERGQGWSELRRWDEADVLQWVQDGRRPPSDAWLRSPEPGSTLADERVTQPEIVRRREPAAEPSRLTQDDGVPVVVPPKEAPGQEASPLPSSGPAPDLDASGAWRRQRRQRARLRAPWKGR